MKVLKLSAQGLPQSWITLEQAVIHYAAEEVRWEAGAEIAVYRGGHNALTGIQSKIIINSIIIMTLLLVNVDSTSPASDGQLRRATTNPTPPSPG